MTGRRLAVDPHLTAVALGKESPDTVLRGGRVVVVHTGEIIEADIAISQGRIAYVGERALPEAATTEIVDVSGKYLLPGFIDGHLHPESSRLSIAGISEVLTSAGTTSIVTGLDHLAASGGIDAVRAALDEAAAYPLTYFWASPFRLPYTVPASTISHPWGAAEHAVGLDWPECIGIWELCPGFVDVHDVDVVAALDAAGARGLGVHGCVPGAGEGLPLVDAHVAAGLRVDHEAYDTTELLEKLRRGMASLIRDSPVERFLDKLIPLAVERPELRHLMGFCTDGFDAADVRAHGHISALVRRSIALGLDPVAAIQMATLNTARAYGIDHRVGSLTPGTQADILVCSALEDPTPELVFARGVRVLATRATGETPPDLAVYGRDVTVDELEPRVDPGVYRVNAIEMTENAFYRRATRATVEARDGVLRPDPKQDLALVAYVDSRRVRPNPGLAFVTGFGLKSGALATTTAPDDENPIGVGTNARDLALALTTVMRRGGGEVVVDGGEILAFMSLPIHGVLSDRSVDEVIEGIDAVTRAARNLGCGLPEPMKYLGLLEITGLPDAAMSERGMVEFATSATLPLIADRLSHY